MDEMTDEVREEILAFKGYQRLLMRQLKTVKDAVMQDEKEKAIATLDGLIADTQNNLES